MSKLLIIGPLNYKKRNDHTGGIVVLFDNFLSFIKDNNIQHITVDTNKKNYSNILSAYLCILSKITYSIFKCTSVSLHGTAKDFLYIAPYVVALSKLLKKKISLRKFAGNFDIIYNKSNILSEYIYRYCLHKADILFFETRYLVQFGLKFNNMTYWLPNVRNKYSGIINIDNKKYKKNFVFISHIKKEKGVNEVLEVFSKLDNSFHIDFYGQLIDFSQDDFKHSNINYKGILASSEVTNILTNYDVLVLPSYHPGEGYPGIIIEALSVGMPVIASNFGGIPEIITNNKNGFLIAPKNSNELLKAVLSINDENYKKLAENALNDFALFDANKVYNNTLTLII